MNLHLLKTNLYNNGPWSKSIIQLNITKLLTYFFYQRKYIIGRAQNKTDITLNDGTVSRLHAELDNSGSKITLKDLGSSNGTFVNRKQLPPQTSMDINLNEKITFGEFQHYLVVELLKEKDTSLYENINNHYKKHKRRHHSRHRRYHSNERKKSDSSISSSVDYKNEDKSSVSSREYERNNKEDVVRHRKRKAKSRSRSKSKCKRNKVSSVIQNVKKEEMITKENERQIKLYNEYLLVKEMEMKNDRIEKLPKLIPKN